MSVVGVMRCLEFLSFGSQPGGEEHSYPHLCCCFKNPYVLNGCDNKLSVL